MGRMIRMTEYRMKDLIYLSHAYGVSITFSGLDCSVVTVTNQNGTSYEVQSSFCFSNWFDYRRYVMRVMSALASVPEV